MKQIATTLPALGTYTVNFHEESAVILEKMGESELSRLDGINHLGIASSAFTGVNHSRLEYMLLQCAVIELLPKFHKDDERLAISGAISIDGLKKPVSSGEELLKSWALLGNYGHTQLTYGPERALIQHARQNVDFRRILLSGLWKKDIKLWCEQTIDSHVDSHFHYVIALRRICRQPRSKAKGLSMHLLRNLILPLNQLELSGPSQAYKLYKLRELYGNIRLICIVALDAYYSHHPVRFQISGALMNLSQLLDDSEEGVGFVNLLKTTAGWLADEIYLHPNALAVLRQYEVDSATKLLGNQYKKLLSTKDGFDEFLPNLLGNGFGNPKKGKLEPLLRLSFSTTDFSQYNNFDYQLACSLLEDKLVPNKSLRISVAENVYTHTVHVDFFYDPNKCTFQHIATLYSRMYKWLLRRLEATALSQIRRIPGLTKKENPEIFDDVRRYYLERELRLHHYFFQALFDGLIKYILPSGYSGVVTDFVPLNELDKPIMANLKFYSGGHYQQLTEKINHIIGDNPRGVSPQRLHELETIASVITSSRAPLILACTETYIVKDNFRRNVDEWDGIVIEIFDDRVRLKILEAKKMKGAKGKRERNALKQLEKTRELIRTRHKLKTRRTRLKGQGALLTVSGK